MRYAINFDKTINQLVPYYLGGRRLILFLQSCIKPLQLINQQFVEYAKETRIEAAMTSQIFKLEWFLNRKFQKYFANPADRIVIKNGEKMGVVVYNQSATDIPDDDQLKVYTASEKDLPHPVFHHSYERTEGASYSFLVCVPKLCKSTENKDTLRDGLTSAEFEAMLGYWVDRYKLANKTCKIIINE